MRFKVGVLIWDFNYKWMKGVWEWIFEQVDIPVPLIGFMFQMVL
jgi:hypothetical protein